MSTKLDRLSELAKEDGKRRFFSIAHLITPEAMYAAFRSLRKDASAGVDGVTYERRRGKYPELTRTAQRWEVPSPALAQGLHPQGKREAEANLDSCLGGQDRAKGDGGGAKCHL